MEILEMGLEMAQKLEMKQELKVETESDLEMGSVGQAGRVEATVTWRTWN